MAIALIEEAQEERNRLIAYKREYEKVRVKDNEDPNSFYKHRGEVDKAFTPTPHKSKVNDNLKMARRIILGEYM